MKSGERFLYHGKALRFGEAYFFRPKPAPMVEAARWCPGVELPGVITQDKCGFKLKFRSNGGTINLKSDMAALQVYAKFPLKPNEKGYCLVGSDWGSQILVPGDWIVYTKGHPLSPESERYSQSARYFTGIFIENQGDYEWPNKP